MKKIIIILMGLILIQGVQAEKINNWTYRWDTQVLYSNGPVQDPQGVVSIDAISAPNSIMTNGLPNCTQGYWIEVDMNALNFSFDKDNVYSGAGAWLWAGEPTMHGVGMDTLYHYPKIGGGDGYGLYMTGVSRFNYVTWLHNTTTRQHYLFNYTTEPSVGDERCLSTKYNDTTRMALSIPTKTGNSTLSTFNQTQDIVYGAALSNIWLLDTHNISYIGYDQGYGNLEFQTYYYNGSNASFTEVILINKYTQTEYDRGISDYYGRVEFIDLPWDVYEIWIQKLPNWEYQIYYPDFSFNMDNLVTSIYLPDVFGLQSVNTNIQYTNFGAYQIQSLLQVYRQCDFIQDCNSIFLANQFCEWLAVDYPNSEGYLQKELVFTKPIFCTYAEDEIQGISEIRGVDLHGIYDVNLNISLDIGIGQSVGCVGFFDSITYDYVQQVNVTIERAGVYFDGGITEDLNGDGKYRFCFNYNPNHNYDIFATKSLYDPFHKINEQITYEQDYYMNPIVSNVSEEYKHILGGYIFNEDENKIPYFNVRLECDENPTRYASTNNSGFYQFSNLLRGLDCCVITEDVTYSQERKCTTISQNNTGFNLSVEELEQGENDINVLFSIVESSIYSGGSLMPVENAKVHIQRSGYSSKRCTTDSTGNCMIRGLNYGSEYMIEVSKTGYEIQAITEELTQTQYQIQIYPESFALCNAKGMIKIENLTETYTQDGVIVNLRDQAGNKIRETKTDENGDYNFNIICKKDYTIEAIWEGKTLTEDIKTESAEGGTIKQDFTFLGKDKEWGDSIEEAIDFLKLLFPFFFFFVMGFLFIAMKMMINKINE